MPPEALRKTSRGQGTTTLFPRLLGGRLCLDFANTIEGPISAAPTDFLPDYAALVNWARHAGLIENDELIALLGAGQRNRQEVERVFTRATALRSALIRVFRRIAAASAPPPDDLLLIRAEYAAALASGLLTRRGDRFVWSWPRRNDALELPLWRVIDSAVELLRDGELHRIKQCPGADDCGWLFYDSSRNGVRRWCSMDGCGSRVKMRRHYARHKAK